MVHLSQLRSMVKLLIKYHNELAGIKTKTLQLSHQLRTFSYTNTEA